MNLRIITKNHAADLKIGSPLKIDFRANWTHEFIPTAWELILGLGVDLCFQFDANENFFKLFEGSDKIVKISVNFDGFKK